MGIQRSFTMTAVSNPVIHFGGRFQARFATDGDLCNEPRGISAGWNFAMEGEPDFVPKTENVPVRSGMAVGRAVRIDGGAINRPR
jgi:hypothetical protein